MSVSQWDLRFIELARHVSTWSKDPSTKIGAVIADHDNRVRGLGYNGFPRRVADDPARLQDRPTKLQFVVHAELNAILNARGPVDGCTLYGWPLFTCGECAKAIIQAGIARVVAPAPAEERWRAQYEAALAMYGEAAVRVDMVPA